MQVVAPQAGSSRQPIRLGLPITAITQVQVIKTHIETLAEIEARLTESPYVQQCYYVSGNWDFVPIILARDPEHYSALVRELFQDNPYFKRFEAGAGNTII